MVQVGFGAFCSLVIPVVDALLFFKIGLVLKLGVPPLILGCRIIVFGSAVYASFGFGSRVSLAQFGRQQTPCSRPYFLSRKQSRTLGSSPLCRREVSKKKQSGICRGSRIASAVAEGDQSPREAERPPPYQCLVQVATAYNNIVILEGAEDAPLHYAGCRILLLDDSGNVHSVYRRHTAWTGSYWDEFATLPAVIPSGPVAILGLGAGTCARLILDLWPSRKLIGYEIDGLLVHQAREYLGLSALEVPRAEGGVVSVVVDDAFADSATVEGGFAGIIVDLFAGGEVLPQLRQPETWFSLKRRLMPGGRIMVNCGGACVEKSDSKADVDNGTWTWEDGAARKEATLSAMAVAFPNQLNWRKMANQEASNVMALTGDLPDLGTWAASVPDALKESVLSWKAFS
ncbi:hypothetical protein R1sor_027294 [Riccia sorocarpa]|uniref:Spermidine synthase n=1 Tax=Riccia sorocarpa TaxID=122646 RepID=A0ABD3GFB1_9MARC